MILALRERASSCPEGGLGKGGLYGLAGCDCDASCMSIDVEGQLSGREYDPKFLLKHAIDRRSSAFIHISAMALNISTRAQRPRRRNGILSLSGVGPGIFFLW